MPCRNTDNVVAALREFDQGKRSAMSKNTLENGRESVTYDMMITYRKSRGKEPDGDDAPEKRYIGFATNRPSVDTEEYAKRGHRDHVQDDRVQ